MKVQKLQTFQACKNLTLGQIVQLVVREVNLLQVFKRVQEGQVLDHDLVVLQVRYCEIRAAVQHFEALLELFIS